LFPQSGQTIIMLDDKGNIPVGPLKLFSSIHLRQMHLCVVMI
jgi:hypothetical protein